VHFRPEDRSAASARSAAVWFLFFSAILAITSQVVVVGPRRSGCGKENTPTDDIGAACSGSVPTPTTPHGGPGRL
jgi:hypothetical protein